MAGERLNDGLMGAGAGAIVGGPVGAVSGGAIGYVAGPSISMGSIIITITTMPITTERLFWPIGKSLDPRARKGRHAAALFHLKPFRPPISGLRRDLDFHRHAQKGVRGADEAAGHRHRLTDVAPHRHGNQIEAADAAVGGIEGDPAGAGHENFRPGVRGARSGRPVAHRGSDKEIAGDDARAKAQTRAASTNSTAKSRHDPQPRSSVSTGTACPRPRGFDS